MAKPDKTKFIYFGGLGMLTKTGRSFVSYKFQNDDKLSMITGWKARLILKWMIGAWEKTYGEKVTNDPEAESNASDPEDSEDSNADGETGSDSSNPKFDMFPRRYA